MHLSQPQGRADPGSPPIRKHPVRHIPVHFDCDVNGSQFTLPGHIEIVSGGGHAVAQCEFDRAKLPQGFQPEILSFVSITGYPDASLNIGAAVNPFNDQDANFRTRRSLDLGPHGQLFAEYGSQRRGTPEEIISFRVEGTVDLPDRINGIEPLCEVWEPDPPDQFLGRMTFSWNTARGVISGHAESTYALRSRIPLTRPQMRVISFRLESGEGHFRQIEAIRLFDMAEWSA